MSKLKLGISRNVEGGLSRRTGSFTKKFLAVTGSTALIVGGASSVLIGASAASATTLVSASYTVGSKVTAVTYSQSSTTGGASSVNTLGFTATDGVAAGSAITLTLTSGTAGVAPFSGAGPSSVIITSGGNSVVVSTADIVYTAATNLVTASTLAVTLPTGFSVASGASVTLQFTATNTLPGASTTFTPSVTTVNDPVVTSGTSYTLSVPASTAITTSLSNSLNGASANLTIGNMYLYDSTTPAASFPSSTSFTGTLQLTYANGTLPTSASAYAVSYTNPTTNVATTVPAADYSVTGGGTSPAQIVISAGYQIPKGEVVSITVTGVINPSTGSSVTPSIAASDTNTTAQTWVVASSSTGTAAGTVNPLSLGSPTSVSGLTITPASTAAAATTSYAFNFKATSTLTNGSVNVTLASGTTVSNTGAFVVDNTTGQTLSATVTPGTGTATNTGTVAITGTVNAGDNVSITLLGVTNPSTGGADSGSVSTTTDSVAVSASYTIAAPTSTTLSPVVSLSSSAAGVTSTYTITNIVSAAAYAKGSTTGQIDLYFTTGTGLPLAPSDYTITDLTNSSGSGAPATVTADTTIANYSGVDLTVANPIAQNDQLKIVISGVINPSGGTYTAQFAGVNAASQAVSAFPSAGMSYPNGAFVQSGSQIDVIAGGYGFGIPSASVYSQIAANDAATVVDGSFPTATAPRAGTLIQVAGSAGIWVVGTDGKLYQFSTPAQFLGDGYSPNQVVTVPSAGGLTVGTGTPPSAATTMADGSVQNFGGTFYVFDGGQAFGIPNLADANSIIAATGATPIVGSGSAPMAGTIANGSVLEVLGSTNVYVTSGGTAYLATGTNLTTNGYTTMYAVPVPSLGSMPTM